MAVFPPHVPVELRVDGHPISAYVRAYEAGGHVYAPVAPLFERIADAVWFNGGRLTFVRHGRRVSIRLQPRRPDALDGVVVAVAPLLRALGGVLDYQPHARRLWVRLPSERVVVTPSPFVPTLPSAVPRAVFTPQPVVTPRPVWSGSPLPRRTPLPYGPPR